MRLRFITIHKRTLGWWIGMRVHDLVAALPPWSLEKGRRLMLTK